MVRVENKMISVKFRTLYTKAEEEIEKKNQVFCLVVET